MLSLDDLSLAAGARSLSLELISGDSYAVMGPAGSGKRRLVDVLVGRAKPDSGRVVFGFPAAKPTEKEYGRRQTPQIVAKSLAKRTSSSKLTTVLSALGLWDVRQTPIHLLEPEQVAACDLLPVFVPENGLAIIDGQLDTLDPWVRATAIGLLEDQRAQGCAFVVSTNLTTVAQRLGGLIVFSGSSPVYAGTVADLLRTIFPAEIVIETSDPSTVSSMVEPFSLSVKQVEGGLLIQTDKGQELAAKLLTLGYGQVRTVVVKEPTLAEALLHLV